MNEITKQKLLNLLTFLSFTTTFSIAIYAIMLIDLKGFAALSFPIIPIYALGLMTLSYFITKQLKKRVYDWNLLLKITVAINFLLLSVLLFQTISNLNNTSGTQKALWKSVYWRGWAGGETHYFFEPFVGWFGLVISVFTYFQFRLEQVKNWSWNVLIWLPMVLYILLLMTHFVLIKKPIFYG